MNCTEQTLKAPKREQNETHCKSSLAFRVKEPTATMASEADT